MKKTIKIIELVIDFIVRNIISIYLGNYLLNKWDGTLLAPFLGILLGIWVFIPVFDFMMSEWKSYKMLPLDADWSLIGGACLIGFALWAYNHYIKGKSDTFEAEDWNKKDLVWFYGL